MTLSMLQTAGLVLMIAFVYLQAWQYRRKEALLIETINNLHRVIERERIK